MSSVRYGGLPVFHESCRHCLEDLPAIPARQRQCAQATMDALSKAEWQLRQQADLISRFGLKAITLMMQKHTGVAL
ncbi:hypothetical protein P4S72_18115 [Vibrio sp. PP-XX7]